jgi:hypothetical protein
VSKYIASVPALAQHTISHKDFEVLQDIRTVLNAAHRTQELLSSHKTPTLSFAVPLYHALIQRWRKLQESMPALSHAIGEGVAKLEEYLNKTRSSPAHVLAMALNPSIRYSWIEQHWSSEEAEKAKALVEEHVSVYVQCYRSLLNCFHHSYCSALKKARPSVTRPLPSKTHFNRIQPPVTQCNL